MRDLAQDAIVRLARQPPRYDVFELSTGKVARFPILAFVGSHCGHLQAVLDGARKRVAEERQGRRVTICHICGEQQTRVTGR